MGYWDGHDRDWDERQRMMGAAKREAEATKRALNHYASAFAAWFTVLWLAGGLRGWEDLGLIALSAFGSVRIAEILRSSDEAGDPYSRREGR